MRLDHSIVLVLGSIVLKNVHVVFPLNSSSDPGSHMAKGFARVDTKVHSPMDQGAQKNRFRLV